MAVKYIYIKEGHKPSFFHIISFMEILNMASLPILQTVQKIHSIEHCSYNLT